MVQVESTVLVALPRGETKVVDADFRPDQGLAVLLRGEEGLRVWQPSRGLSWPSPRNADIIRWLPESRLLLASYHSFPERESDDGEGWAVIVDDQGRRSGRIAIGSFVSQLLVASSGEIWIGYMDQGIYSDDKLAQETLGDGGSRA